VLSSSRPKGQTLRYFLALFFGTIYCRTLQAITASYYRGAQGVILGTSIHRATFLPSWLTGISLSSLAHALPHMCNASVYDVSNRESFEALPRWLDELENYVPPEVVKIVVGNKLDKVK
jgi:GTPase SAR1 family protein